MNKDCSADCVAFLKTERKKQGITQVSMAKSLKVGRRQYQRWERGSMPADKLEEMGEVLGFKVLVLNKEVLTYERK